MSSHRFVFGAVLVPLLACCASNQGDDGNESATTGTEPTGDGDTSASGDGDDGNLTVNPGQTGVGVCGDGALESGQEACDDGNQEDGDGCQGNCLALEPGFICRTAGEPCEPFARCGDGVLAYPEQCDDGGFAPGDGCSAFCKVELGFKCDESRCSPTVCGDGVVEGAETCDEGPENPEDNCSASCVGQPDCSGGACTSVCGDGIVLGEECDDGNLLDGDGCSASCTPEAGYECTQERACDGAAGECVLEVPAVFRDFNSDHPDFGGTCQVDEVVTGIVENQLLDGKPTPNGPSPHCAARLEDWYRDSPDSFTLVGQLELYGSGDGRYVNRWGSNGEKWSFVQNDGSVAERDGNPLFFPVDGVSNVPNDDWGVAKIGGDYYRDESWPTEQAVLGGQASVHNFFFTTEVTYWFAFTPDTNATLDFTGDDDVWVFVNGTLAVDLGGTHAPEDGSVSLNATTAPNFGLTAGNVYEIKVFHAERKKEGSSFRLTLDGFETSRSVCVPRCGDGIIGFGEECDDGENDGGYNGCQSDCTLGDYCGDGVVQASEACDDGDLNAPAECNGCSLVQVR